MRSSRSVFHQGHHTDPELFNEVAPNGAEPFEPLLLSYCL
jgi:hypothetical protein